VLLLTKDKKVPMLWKVLSNKYNKMKFGIHRDTEGMMAVTLGADFGSGHTGSKVLIFPAGSTVPAPFDGMYIIS
jgi:protein disulfide-isomerase A6